MKKTIISAAAVMSLLFVAVGCNNKDNEFHQSVISHPTSGMGYIYADQTSDTIKFSTTENFSFSSNAEWAKLDPGTTTGTVKQGFVYVGKIPVTFEPNKTGEVRTALVKGVLTSDGYEKEIGLFYQQVSWLNIITPRPLADNVNKRVFFAATDSAHWVRDSLRFDTFGDWTLAVSSGDFVQPQKLSGKAGYNSIGLVLTPNDTKEQRQATLVLTSNGVTTPITYIQLPKNEK